MTESEFNNDFITRNYCDDDFENVIHFWDLTDMGNPERGDNKLTIRRTIELGGCLLVMENKSTKQICGTSWMTTDGRRTLLHHFGILPNFQGKGLSKILLNESLQFIKKQGNQVKLEVHSTNYKAINLYKKFGFTHLGEYKVFIIRDISKF
jgi:ribosomal protein S18 acetylase RimI-like enzyme